MTTQDAIVGLAEILEAAGIEIDDEDSRGVTVVYPDGLAVRWEPQLLGIAEPEDESR